MPRPPRSRWRPRSCLDELRDRYSSEFYAHGVATTVKQEHNPPAAAEVSEAAIYLDVETIRGVAAKLGVSHEAVHGWLAEGDAQRDAWQALTDALADPQWATIVREGRAAQLRMAQQQPGAYTRFDATVLDYTTLLGDFPLPERRSWVVGTPRPLFDVMLEAGVEVPVKGPDLPTPGDIMYLGTFETLGPGSRRLGARASIAGARREPALVASRRDRGAGAGDEG
jgi:hypothetical protein